MYHLHQIPSDTKIRTFLRQTLFGANLFCPDCRSRRVYRYESRYRCRRCRGKFSLTSHTWLTDCKLSYQSLWLLLWCWTTQVPVRQTEALTERSEEAVRRWYGHFRAHLPETPVILEKIVQLDEAYFRDQALVLGKQVGTKRLAHALLTTASVDRRQTMAFLAQHIKPRTRLQTDGAAIYQGIEAWWPVEHRRDIHKKFEFGQTSEIEGMFGTLRTFIRRMYHHATPAQLPELVREFCTRFSSPELFQNPRIYLTQTLHLCTN